MFSTSRLQMSCAIFSIHGIPLHCCAPILRSSLRLVFCYDYYKHPNVIVQYLRGNESDLLHHSLTTLSVRPFRAEQLPPAPVLPLHRMGVILCSGAFAPRLCDEYAREAFRNINNVNNLDPRFLSPASPTELSVLEG